MEAINMLKGRALLLLMSDEVRDLNGGHAAKLFDLVGDMTREEAVEAIKIFEATQTN